MVALVDADSLLYRIGFSFEDSTDWGDGATKTTDVVAAKNAIDGVIENILFKTGCDSVELWLTGTDNFRHSIVSDYKHNRSKSTRPLCYSELWEYMVLKYGAKVAVGYEADDMVVCLKIAHPDDYFVCALDKDVLYQTAGTHYNYKTSDFIEVTPSEAIRFFYYQLLRGDPTDGYIGCKGIGDMKANQILNQAELIAKDENVPVEAVYYGKTVVAYMNSFDCDEDTAIDMIKITGQLACMHQLKWCDKTATFTLDLWCNKPGDFGVFKTP